ncbi:MAG: hypothetical protein IT436_07665 [Phycisphaerales bacterium]|nr:hypothetical protein [Phycisphaerales bacterium]
MVSVVSAVGILSVLLSCSGVQVYDLNPNTPDGETKGLSSASTAGLTLRVDGRPDYLYAVTLNAGVYRSIPAAFGGAWVQLNASPPGAYSLAVDPRDVRHIVVGERDGDRADPAANTAGAWESLDGGNTWGGYLDPRSLDPQCVSQAVPSVAITSNGTLVAATDCGIAFRPIGGQWGLAQLPSGFPADRITAVAASRSRVWARDGQYNLVVSDSGAAVFANATSQPRPAAQIAATGDSASLAAFDTLAVMVCRGDTVNSGAQNLTRLIMYDAATDAWIDQGSVAGAVNGNGNFSIGRRFVKAYTIGEGRHWGSEQQLYVCNAQEVFRAVGRNRDGTFVFVRVAGTTVSGGGSTIPNWKGTLHPDIWDFHLAPDESAAWVAHDGGVVETLMDGKGWHTRSNRLNTHHVQHLFVPFDGHHLAYGTQDNDAWTHNQPGLDWQTTGGMLGDCNFVAGDAGKGSAALLVRDVGNAVLTGFGSALPTSGQAQAPGVVVNNDQFFFQSPVAFRFIQTRQGEQFANPLDAVVLTRMPFTWTDANGPQMINAGGQPFALVRNQNFEVAPDVAGGTDTAAWQLAADNLPANPRAFCVSGMRNGPGAHTAPIYYLLAGSAGAPRLFRSDGQAQGTAWTPVPNQPAHIVDNGLGYRNGPVFVNPYDADMVYVLTTDGIFVSTNATDMLPTFDLDGPLSQLVSGNGAFDFKAGFQGGDGTNVDKAFQNGSWPMETLSDMVFDHANPTHVAAASAFTGVFVNLGDGVWRDLSPYLPKPRSSIVSVGLVGNQVYVGTLGRGVLRLDGVNRARGLRKLPAPASESAPKPPRPRPDQ